MSLCHGTTPTGLLNDGLTVVKKECVEHVAKKSWNCITEIKEEKKSMGGKGRLTDVMIDKLQNYYGIAIRSNSGDLAVKTSW